MHKICQLHQGQNVNYVCYQCNTYACDQCVIENHAHHLRFLEILNQDDAQVFVTFNMKQNSGVADKFYEPPQNPSLIQNQIGEVLHCDIQLLSTQGSNAHEESKVQPQAIQNLLPSNVIEQSQRQIPIKTLKQEDYNEFFSKITNQQVLEKMERYPQIKITNFQSRSIKREVRPMVTSNSGSIYLGEWNIQTNLRDGLGMQIYPDGSLYGGKWKHGERNGKGLFKNTLIHSNGNITQGSWKNDRIEGSGLYTFINGTEYIGFLVNDKFHGSGVFKDSNGDQFNGSYEIGKKHGQGRFVGKDGNKYKGNYIDDKKDVEK
eukprot:403367737